MKTVLQLIETAGPGGAEKMLISLVEHLDASRYRTVVCLLKDGWLNQQLQKRGIESFVVPQPRSLDVAWILSVRSLIRRLEVSVIHTHEFAMNAYGCLLSALTGLPAIATVHGKNYYCDRWRRRFAYRCVSRGTKLVAVSKDIGIYLNKKVGIRPEDVATIYNGIDLGRCLPDEEEKEKIRRKLGIHPLDPVVGTVGNLYPVKGHVYLLRSAASLKRRFPTLRVLIAGRGKLEGDLRSESKRLGIEENVRFLGFRDDVPALLQAMDVFVLPSLSEGLPLSVLEAMASEKPVVATRVGGIPEVVVDGENGFLVRPHSLGELAGGLAFLLDHRGLARQWGKAGRARVEKTFNVHRMAQEYSELYEGP